MSSLFIIHHFSFIIIHQLYTMKQPLFIFCAIIVLSLLNSQCTNQATTTKQPEKTAMSKKYKTIGSIERTNPKIDQLIPKTATIEILAEGFTWSEGPLWLPKQSKLIFSDVPENKIYQWSAANGLSDFLSPSGFTGTITTSKEPGSNGLTLNPQGDLILCQHGDRRVAKMTAPWDQPAATFETITDRFEGKRFSSPNDLIYDKAGNLYFTDPPYGLGGQMDDPEKELPFQGVFRLSTTGVLSLVTDQMTRPNGLALSPDERTLYVANSDPEKALWMAYTLNKVGAITEGRVFYDATSVKEKGLPDGLKIDRKGNIWATGPGGVWIFDTQANVLGKIKTGEATANCAFDETEKTFYMTADMYLLRVKL